MPDDQGQLSGACQRRKRRVLRRWVLRAVVLLIVAVAMDYFLYPAVVQPGGESFNTGENGIWLRYTWYFGRRTPAQVDELAAHLRGGGISYVYCHVRHIQADGSLKYRYETKARSLVSALHRKAPGTTVFAWVYVGNDRGSPPVELTKTAVRRRMVAEAAWLVERCGFDGIQWDYEICKSGDPLLLSLLRETRAVLPKGTPISVCSPMWYARPTSAFYGWRPEYFRRVARLCDQITVMCYDSGVFFPRAYVWLVRYQATEVTRAVAGGNPHCRVLLGIPTYGESGRSHNPRAENIRLALKGVREGLADPRAARPAFAGVALFADYTTTENEWRTYAKWWPLVSRPTAEQ